MKTITIIEDDIALNNGIALALKNNEYSFTHHYRLGDFDPNEPTDIIILDINLPDGNGFEFLKKSVGLLISQSSFSQRTTLKLTKSQDWNLARTTI